MQPTKNLTISKYLFGQMRMNMVVSIRCFCKELQLEHFIISFINAWDYVLSIAIFYNYASCNIDTDDIVKIIKTSFMKKW